MSASDLTEPNNISNPNEFSMIKLVNLVLRLVGSISKIVFMPLQQRGTRQRKSVISLAHAKLAWQPLVSLEGELKETIGYFKKCVQL